MTARGPAMLAGAVLAAAAAPRAEAHLVSTQLGPFYDAAAHALASPEDLLSIVAVALLAGLGGPRHGRWALVALAGGWLAGAAAASAAVTPQAQVPLVAAGTLLLLGSACAADVRVGVVLLGATAAVIGLARGALGGAAPPDGGGTWVAAVGAASGAFVLAALLLAGAVRLGERRARIALRVGGSWLAAIGLLMVGWQIHAAR